MKILLGIKMANLKKMPIILQHGSRNGVERSLFETSGGCCQ